MPVEEVLYFLASCDECWWVSLEQETAEQAKTLLDNHIKDKH